MYINENIVANYVALFICSTAHGACLPKMLDVTQTCWINMLDKHVDIDIVGFIHCFM